MKLVPKIGVALYLLAALPLMFFLMGRILVRFPQVFVSIWKGELTAISAIGKAMARSDWFSAAAASIGALVLALIPLGIALTTSSLFSRMGRGMWRWSAGSEARRAFAFSAFAAGCLVLGAAWMPSGNWEQIQLGFQQRASIERRPAVLHVQIWDPAPAESWSRRVPGPPRRTLPSAPR